MCPGPDSRTDRGAAHRCAQGYHGANECTDDRGYYGRNPSRDHGCYHRGYDCRHISGDKGGDCGRHYRSDDRGHDSGHKGGDDRGDCGGHDATHTDAICRGDSAGGDGGPDIGERKEDDQDRLVCAPDRRTRLHRRRV